MEIEKLDDRAYVEIHMLQTIDGKAIGDFWEKPDVKEGIREYNNLYTKLNGQGIALGRVTMSGHSNEVPDLSKYNNKEILKHKDFIVPLKDGIKYYFISYDKNGTLGFKSNVVNTADWGKDGTEIYGQMIEVLSENVSNEYLQYCQEKGISYIFTGKDKIDIKTSLIKLKKLFGINKLLLQGGPKLCGSFIKDDLVDEISLIILPCTSTGDATLFNPSAYKEFKLIEIKELSNSNIWLHYIKKNEVGL